MYFIDFYNGKKYNLATNQQIMFSRLAWFLVRQNFTRLFFSSFLGLRFMVQLEMLGREFIRSSI